MDLKILWNYFKIRRVLQRTGSTMVNRAYDQWHTSYVPKKKKIFEKNKNSKLNVNLVDETDSFNELVRSFLALDWRQRLTVRDALNHPWVLKTYVNPKVQGLANPLLPMVSRIFTGNILQSTIRICWRQVSRIRTFHATKH